MSKQKASPGHRFRFYRAGGVDQVRLDRGEDILALAGLDQKLWVALSCPVKGLEIDERTLALLDSDGDGRVRAPEILAAVEWIGACLKDPDTLLSGSDSLALSSLDERKPEGKRLLASARRILAGLGKGNATAISVADTMKTAEMFAIARLNGDGIVTPEAIEDAGARQLAEEIIVCLGGLQDRSGKTGVDLGKLDSFFEAVTEYDAWMRESEGETSAILPLGDATAQADAALERVRGKVEDYFARCRLAAYDARAQAALNREESAYLALAAKDLKVTSEEIACLPLAHIEAGQALPLSGAVNPAWEEALAAFSKDVVAPMLGEGRKELTEEDWAGVDSRLAPYRTWISTRRGDLVASLGAVRAREILQGDARAMLAAEIEEDAAVADEIDAITAVEKLVRYHRDLHHLLRNYVSFSDFYSRGRKAVFQAGTLYLDGRSCDLVVRVDDPAKHGVLAAMARTFLVYCDCTRAASGERMTIAAAFTAGDSDYLFVGRNGLFYDSAGRDWDATITKIVDHPISVRQAFFMPYKRFLRWIEEQIARRAAAADASSMAKLTAATEPTAAAPAASTSAAPPRPRFDVGTIAALGVAVGGITAAFGALLGSFFGLGKWMPLGVVALILLISGPSVVIAWLKLRQRNLGPILDANGWAVNSRVKINIPLGATLTHLGELPEGAERALLDPYAPVRHGRRNALLAVLVLALVALGLQVSGTLAPYTESLCEWIVSKL